jgi:predicted GNAT family acetyltransferase
VDPEVVDNRQARRFELYDDGELAGFAEYHLYDNRLALLHTEIDARFRGRGLGGKLVHQVLDDARARGQVVLPYCRFTRGWIAKHPAYVDLVPEAHRAHFDLLPGREAVG